MFRSNYRPSTERRKCKTWCESRSSTGAKQRKDADALETPYMDEEEPQQHPAFTTVNKPLPSEETTISEAPWTRIHAGPSPFEDFLLYRKHHPHAPRSPTPETNSLVNPRAAKSTARHLRANQRAPGPTHTLSPTTTMGPPKWSRNQSIDLAAPGRGKGGHFIRGHDKQLQLSPPQPAATLTCSGKQRIGRPMAPTNHHGHPGWGYMSRTECSRSKALNWRAQE